MNTSETVFRRRSIRRFLPDPVPRELLRELLGQACWAPSWGNTQPWEVYVLQGEPLERFRRANQEQLRAGMMPSPEMDMPMEWPPQLKTRYAETGKCVLAALGIPREDREARLAYTLDMFGLFGAPCLLFLCVPAAVPRAYAALDIGLFLQTFCLAAAERGLGTCCLASAVGYPGLIRRIAPIRDDSVIVVGVAVGSPDLSAAVNDFSRARARIEEFTTWVE
jgi:nitroreductase